MIDISLFVLPFFYITKNPKIKNPSHIFIFDIFHVYSEKLSSPLFQFFKSIIFLSFLFHRAYFPSHFCSPNRVFIFQNCCFVKIKILGIKNFFACIFYKQNKNEFYFILKEDHYIFPHHFCFPHQK